MEALLVVQALGKAVQEPAALADRGVGGLVKMQASVLELGTVVIVVDDAVVWVEERAPNVAYIQASSYGHVVRRSHAQAGLEGRCVRPR